MKCRFCENTLTHEFVDLGFSPPSNSFLKAEYGKPLRKLIISETNIQQIINIENYFKFIALFNIFPPEKVVDYLDNLVKEYLYNDLK